MILITYEKDSNNKSNLNTIFVCAHLYLQSYRQQDCESVDDFITRLKLQAQKCDFHDDRQSSERVLEQFIAGIRHMELQKELLSTAQDFTIEQALERCRTFEASIAHMKQLAQLRHKEQTSML